MQRVLGVLTTVVLLGAFGCGGSNVDPGTDGGTNSGNDAGTLPDGGNGNNDGGSNPDNEIPFSEWCPTVETGHKNWLLQGEQACGQTGITEADLPHLYQSGIPINQYRLEGYVSCNGLLGAMADKFAASIQAGRMTYDAKAAYDCRQLGRDATGPVDPYDGGVYLTGPCGSVLTGNVQMGESCQYSEECVTGAYCKPGAADSCAGTCEPRVAVGTTCVPERDLCVIDASCEQDELGNYSCVSFADVGEACDNAMCKTGLICSAAGTCAVAAAEGGTCTDSSDCQTGLVCTAGACTQPGAQGADCGEGLPECGACLRCQDPSEVTNGGTTQCVPATVGAACLTDADCPWSSFCDSGSGTCTLRPRPGESCFVSPDQDGNLPTVADQGNCLYGDSFCQRADAATAIGTCALMPKLGEACAVDASISLGECSEGFCSVAAGATSGTCTALLSEGANCNSSDECAMGLYCDTVCTTLPSAGQPCATEQNLCDANSFCADGETGPVCTALFAAGDACTEDDQCQSQYCDVVTSVCNTPCGENYDAASCGCQGEGAKGYSMYLIFALVLLPGLARRRFLRQ